MSLDVTIIYKKPKMVKYNATHATCGSTFMIFPDDVPTEETEWSANITRSLVDKIQGGLRGQSWLQDKGKYIRFAPSQQKNCCLERCFLSCYFRILNTFHVHNPSNRF